MATGGAWGGNRINDAFLGIWKDILRKNGYIQTLLYQRDILGMRIHIVR